MGKVSIKDKKPIETIKGTNPHLSWVLLMAYRYAVHRHGTQALCDIDHVIMENIHLMQDEFIRQMITGIHDEMRMQDICGKNTYSLLYFGRSLEDLTQVIKECREKGDFETASKLGEIISDIDALRHKINEAEECVKQPIEELWFRDDTRYLNEFLEELQSEYERRGHNRIDKEVCW